MKNFSLRIFVSFLTAMVIICVLLIAVFFQWQKKDLKKHLVDNGQVLARVLAQNVVLDVFSGDRAALASSVEAILRQPDVSWVAVYDGKGELLVRKHHSGSSMMSLEKEVRLPADQLVPTERQREDGQELMVQEAVRLSSYTSQDALYFSDPSAVHETVVGFVRVGFNEQRLHENIRALLFRSCIVGVFILLIGALVTYFVIWETTKPLNCLIDEIKTRGVEVEPEPETGDQLSLLSGTYSHLVARLGKAFDTIHEMKDSLEATVDQRTQELASANEELSQRQVYLEETNRKLEETLNQLKETQAQMVQSGKMVALGYLVAGVAHEINNTTNFITGALPSLNRNLQDFKELLAQYELIDRRATKKVIVEQLREAEEIKDEIDYDRLLRNLDVLFANIKEGARRTSEIVKDLKNFARPGTAEWKPIDIHESLDSTMSLLYSKYKHQIEIVKEYDPDLPLVPCSPSHLNQVFMNILLNAVQAMAGPGRLRVRTWREGENLHIGIQDSGPGIPEDIRSHIFEPFFTTKTVGQGTGLGLSISYGIIKKHQGRIVVRSEPGQGTEFEIILPLAGTGSLYLTDRE